MRTSTRGASRRRPLAIAALSAASIIGVSACGSNTSSPNENSTQTAAGSTEQASGNTVDVEHYFSGDLGAKAFDELLPICQERYGQTAAKPTIDHEAFKDAILVQLSGGNPPDVFSYWAGAKTQSLVDAGLVETIDDAWSAADVDASIPPALTESAATYDDSKYLLPFGFHYVGMFYNPKVLADAGITTMPTSLSELVTVADQLKAAGVAPFALGSKERWPAQFWFDYLLLRTAGPDYRQELMAGDASYTDPEVGAAFEEWRELLESEYFNGRPNDIDWTDAADQVANGDAAMTLMGTWITGYWDGKGLEAGTDYDFFPFPEVTPGVPQAALGPVDGWVMASASAQQENASKMLECFWDPEVQAIFAGTQGALPANSDATVDGQSDIMKKAGEQVADADVFVFNYDLATPPAVSEVGLDSFTRFIDNPGDSGAIMESTQAQAERAFNE